VAGGARAPPPPPWGSPPPRPAARTPGSPARSASRTAHDSPCRRSPSLPLAGSRPGDSRAAPSGQYRVPADAQWIARCGMDRVNNPQVGTAPQCPAPACLVVGQRPLLRTSSWQREPLCSQTFAKTCGRGHGQTTLFAPLKRGRTVVASQQKFPVGFFDTG